MASVRKLDPKDPKSKWVVEYTDAGGKRRRKTPKTGLKKDAEAIRQKIEREMGDGLHVSSTESVTVEAACEAFLRLQEDRKKEKQIGTGAIANHKNAIDRNIIPRLGRNKFCELKRQDIEDLYRWMIRELTYKPDTARSRLRTFKQVQDFAVRRGWIKHRPVNDGISDIGKTNKENITTFKTDQVLKLLQTLESGRAHWGQARQFEMTRCLVHVAAFCGLRIGEMGALRVENLDLVGRIIKVRHNRTIWDEIKGPKTKAGIRDVPMPPHVVQLLSDWMSRYHIPNDLDLVFVTRDATPFSFGNFRAYGWTSLLKRAGLYRKDDPFHFHALRHFASSWMMENRLSLPDIAALLGHSSFDTTLQVYAHSITTPAHRLAAMDQMSAGLLSLAGPPDATKPRLRTTNG